MSRFYPVEKEKTEDHRTSPPSSKEDIYEENSVVMRVLPAGLLTDEEKFVIDSNDEMNERKDMIISGIINGKSKFLETTSTKHKTKPIAVRFVKEFDEIVGVDLEKYGPFKPEDIATIPNENAQALISNGIALKVRIEE